MGAEDESATFAIELEDETSGSAASAAGALQKLRDQITGDTKALSEMQAAMKRLQGGTVVQIAQFKELKSKIEAKKNAIAQSQSAYIALGGNFNRTAKAASAAGGRLDAFKKIAAGASPPLGALAGRLQMLVQGTAGVSLATVALVGAIGLLVVGVTAATVVLGRYGVAQADAYRSELLHLEGLALLKGAHGAASSAAEGLQTSIDNIAASSAVGRDKIAGYAEQLYRAGLRGGSLEVALEGVAIKASVLGDASAKAFATQAAAANRAGRSVDALTDKVKAQLGGVASAQMLSLAVQGKKLHESFSALFAGLDIEPLLQGLAGVGSLFSQTTASGVALKALLTSFFQPLVDGAAGALKLVKGFFQGVIIAALEFGIVFHMMRIAVKQALGIESFGAFTKNMDFATAAVIAGRVAVGVLVVSVLALTAAAAYMAAPFLLAGVAIGSVIAAGYQLFQLWKEIDWKDLGASIIAGIKAGVMAHLNMLRDTMKFVGDVVTSGFKSVLGIASPSKVFAKLGHAIPAGVQVGVDSGAPAVRRSLQRVVQVPALDLASKMPKLELAADMPRLSVAADMPRLPAEPRAAAPVPAPVLRAPSSSGPSVHIDELHVHTSSDEPRAVALDFRRELMRVLDELASQMTNPEPEPA